MTHFHRITSLAIAAAGLASARAQTVPDAPDPGSPTVLNKMVVTGQLDQAREEIVPSLGATQYTVEKGQIADQALGINTSFNEILLRAPGVAEDSYGQVHVRGEHANLQYRINDVLLPEGITGFGQELDTPFVDTVSLLTGSLPAQYGYRTAGVVDIHTKSGASLDGASQVSLFGGSFSTLRGSAAVAQESGGLTAFVTASAEESNLGIENPTPSKEAIHDHTHQQKAFGDFSYLIDSTSRISLLLSAASAHFQIPNNPDQDPAFTLQGVPTFASANLNENQTEDNDYAILAYQKTEGDFGLQVSAFSRFSLVKFTPDVPGDLIFNGVASEVHRDIISNGFEADGKWSVLPAHTLRGGLVVIATNASTRTGSEVFATDADGNQLSAVPFAIADDAHELGWLYGAYAQDEWKAAPGLTINYGARADASKAYLSEGQLSPRVNLVYALDPVTSVHLGYARYFTPPPLELVQTSSIAKFTGTTNAPDIDQSSPVSAERAHYFDAGITRTIAQNLSATVDAYDKKATNQLDEGQFGTALIFSPFNYRVGHVYGVEASTNYTNGGFSAYANVAVSHAFGQQIVSGEFQFEPDELAYIAAHPVHLDHDQEYTASIGTSYRLGRNMVYADFLYGSGLRSGFANTDHLPEYHPLNVGLEHDFKLNRGHRLALRVDATNLFDEVYELRDGSGIGVGAPQYGQRRGLFGTISSTF